MDNKNPINYLEEDAIFHLRTNRSSYVIKVQSNSYLIHVYWGKRIDGGSIGWYCEAPYRRQNRIENNSPDNPGYTSEFWPYEYPVFGSSDFRPPAINITNSEGYSLNDLKYKSHRIYKGKNRNKNMPSLMEDNDKNIYSLEIILDDKPEQVQVELLYTVYPEYDIITRSSRVDNYSDKPKVLNEIMSSSIDFKDGQMTMVQLSGTNLRENHIIERELTAGTTSIESTRGISSHVQNPFFALKRKGCTENNGEVFGHTLMYSGNFVYRVHIDQYSSARVQTGINKDTFTWLMEPGKSFMTPEAVLCFSDEGMNGLSRRYHKVFREMMPQKIRKEERQIALNTWEACYFDVSHKRIIELAERAKQIGIELIVLDDGWFGKRNDDSSSLGDWDINLSKFPHGLNGLSKDLKKMGLNLGIWLEPEMISPKSNLYKLQPDWCLHIPGKKRTEWRNQLVLDLSRVDVRQYIYKKVLEVLDNSGISYVKWDMNRRLTEVGNSILPPERQAEITHRYTAGLYEILGKLVRKFPSVTFENCASGGGRFDAGMLYYFTQAWPSDNTDAISRLKIFYGSSLCYPINNFISHVTSVPNHQIKRSTPLSFRIDAAMTGILGFEMDLMDLKPDEIDLIINKVEFYKAHRSLIQFGTLYRIKSPFEGNQAAWMVTSEDKTRCIVWFFRFHSEAEEAYWNIRLTGLDIEKQYKFESTDIIYPGDVLMNVGLNVPWKQEDCLSHVWSFFAI